MLSCLSFVGSMRDTNYNQLDELCDRGICIIIPTYNNEKTIVEVVQRAMEQCRDVIVVNDGSTDATTELLHAVKGITLVEYDNNKGKGKALQLGFRKALEMGFSYAITLDADNQHYPEDIPVLLEVNKKYPGCFVLGRRNLSGVERSFGSKFANVFSNFWFCVQTLQYVPDTQTGYRLYPLHKLYGINGLTSRYEAELELLVFGAWRGVKIVSVPVRVYYPPREERVSHFRPGKDFFRISVLNTFLCLLALVYGWPLAAWRGLRILVSTLLALLFFLVGTLLVITPFSLCYVALSKVVKLDFSAIRKLLHVFGSLTVRMLPLIGVKTRIMNQSFEDFSKPAMIICNHQSHLDLMLQLSLTSKIVFLTNDWVWKSRYFGYVIRHAEYYPISAGIDVILPKLKTLVERGYCISVFPEGTRSPDGQIGRFHKGAFYIAEQLKLDILPLVIYGANRVLPKKGKYIRTGNILFSIGERISPVKQMEVAESILQRAKLFRQFYVNSYHKICNKYDQNA